MNHPNKQHRLEYGQGMVEYALLAAMVAVVVILVLVALSRGLGESYQAIGVAFAGTSDSQPPAEATAEATAEVTEDASAEEPLITLPEPVPGDSGEPVSNPAPGDSSTNLNRYDDAFDGKGNITWRNAMGTWATTSGSFTSSNSNARVVSTNIGLSNYEFSANVRTLESRGTQLSDVSMVLFRVASDNTYYAVLIRKDGMVELAKSVNGQWQGWLSVTATELSPFDNHEFRIKAQKDHIQIFIDGKKYVDYRDPNPIDSGGIGFTNNNAIALVDNVEVDRRGQS